MSEITNATEAWGNFAARAIAEGRPLNSVSQRLAYTNVYVPTGGQDIWLTDEQAAAYDADPDGWTARYFGLTRAQYYEWVDSFGTPLCAATTARGKPCRNHASESQLGPIEWLARHRKELCAVHRRKEIAP